MKPLSKPNEANHATNVRWDLFYKKMQWYPKKAWKRTFNEGHRGLINELTVQLNTDVLA